MPERCCCGLLSITAAAQLFAVIMVLGTVEMVVMTVKSGASSEEIYPTLAGCLTEITCGVLCCIACNKNYSVLMLPITCFLVARIYFMLLSVFLGIYGIFNQHSPVPHFYRFNLEKSAPSIPPVLTIDFTSFVSAKDLETQIQQLTYEFVAWSIFDFGLAIWFFTVFMDCYLYLEYLER